MRQIRAISSNNSRRQSTRTDFRARRFGGEASLPPGFIQAKFSARARPQRQSFRMNCSASITAAPMPARSAGLLGPGLNGVGRPSNTESADGKGRTLEAMRGRDRRVGIAGRQLLHQLRRLTREHLQHFDFQGLVAHRLRRQVDQVDRPRRGGHAPLLSGASNAILSAAMCTISLSCFFHTAACTDF